jgi:hypothetical protein
MLNKKIIISLLLMGICLATIVNAIGLSPLSMDITVEKGKEVEVVRNIQVSNPEENPIRISTHVTGSVADLITVQPDTFELPAGPGIRSSEARPYTWVTVNFKIPREVKQSTYTGEIIFTQQPILGGTMGVSAELGIGVKLNIGQMAIAEFPPYILVMMFVMVVLLVLSIGFKRKMV